MSEEEISPEERLLKVIQNGDSDEASSVQDQPVSVANETTDAPVASSENVDSASVASTADVGEDVDKDNEVESVKGAKPELKLKKDKPSKKVKSDSKPQKSEKVPAIGVASVSNVSKVVDKQGGSVSKYLNWGLAAVILIMLGLTGFDAAVFARESRSGDDVEELSVPLQLGPENNADQDVGIYSLDNLIGIIRNRSVFGEPNARPEMNSQQMHGTQPEQPKENWQVYAKNNLQLMGYSGNEDEAQAILYDSKEMRMQIAKKGTKVYLGDVEVTLERIEPDRVVISDGRNETTVK